MARFLRLSLGVALALVGCAPAEHVRPAAALAAPRTAPRTAAPAPATPPEPSAAPREPLAWAELSAETFARARAERRYVILDGAAEWCHWCHVMEATTYHDPEVRKLLDARFVAVKVDVDARPDIAERYADYGWPATVVFSPEGVELGKYRGYIAPDAMVALLQGVVESGSAATSEGAPPPANPKTPLSDETLAWIARATQVALDAKWDPDEGGWGVRQKAAVGWANAWTLLRAERGDAESRARALFTLDKQARLLDPVFGGIYQYSAASDWEHPHFEKLMTFNAPALDNYAVAYRLTGEEKHRARARALAGYLTRFLRGPEGGFYATQDADLNAHDPSKAFLDGHVYYALDAQARLARGIPRVDTHEYAKENGLAIAAFTTLHEVTRDPNDLAVAETAARRVLATHRVASGGVTHDRIAEGGTSPVLYLGDNATFGWALLRLHAVTKREDWLRPARAIGDMLLRDMQDDAGTGGFFASTADPNAAALFARRRVPFEENVMAARFFVALRRATGEARYGLAAERALRAVATPEQIDERGRFIGDLLLALDEVAAMRKEAKPR